MAINLISPVAVVAHNAGAANLIIAWLKDMPELKIQISVRGPAAKLFCESFPELINNNLSDAMNGAAILLSGTSRNTDFEHNSRLIARENDIKSIGVIDHWVNYEMRFNYNDTLILPDEIWVCDDYSYSLAISCFPKNLVQQKTNRYLVQAVDEINKISSTIERLENKTNILYVLEPFREFWQESDLPSEFQALNYFINNIATLNTKTAIEIRLKPHPSDPHGKYDEWCNNHKSFDVSIDTEHTLHEQIAWADWVVGCETFAMVIALHANKKTLSTLPPWAPQCSLPYKNIMHLRELSE